MEMTKTDKRKAAAALELSKRRQAKDFEYFIDEFAYMWAKEGGDPIKWQLWDCQRDAAKHFQTDQQLIILKTRQIGMSWLSVAYVLWKAKNTPNFHAYITSVGLSEVQEQMNRIRFIDQNLPDHIRNIAVLGGKGCKNNDSVIEFTNGSAIKAVSSRSSAGHGTAPGLYLIDEFSRKENDYQAWRAIKPSLGKKSQVIIVSTSNGRNNLFSELWHGAVAKSNGFTPVFYPATAHPDYTEEYLRDIRSDFVHDEIGYLQAYPMTPEEAFKSSYRGVFPADVIQQHITNIMEKGIEPQTGYLEDGEFVPDPVANLEIWSFPKPGRQYVAGVDVAEGLAGGDWSVTAVIDATNNELVALYRAKVSPENYAYPVEMLARFYNDAWLVVEINKSADYIMSELKATYPMLYCRAVKEHIYDIPTLKPGFRTTSSSKPRIITQLKKTMVDSEHPLMVYSMVVLQEMLAYEQNQNGQLGAAKGQHDDCVMAVALALEGKTTMPSSLNGYTQFQTNSSDNFDWRSF